MRRMIHIHTHTHFHLHQKLKGDLVQYLTVEYFKVNHFIMPFVVSKTTFHSHYSKLKSIHSKRTYLCMMAAHEGVIPGELPILNPSGNVILSKFSMLKYQSNRVIPEIMIARESNVALCHQVVPLFRMPQSVDAQQEHGKMTQPHKSNDTVIVKTLLFFFSYNCIRVTCILAHKLEKKNNKKQKK